MRVMLAAGLLALAATGCCETCRLCRSDTPGVRPEGPPPLVSPPVQGNRPVTPAAGTGQPPAPAGRPAAAPGGAGAYGGTGY